VGCLPRRTPIARTPWCPRCWKIKPYQKHWQSVVVCRLHTDTATTIHYIVVGVERTVLVNDISSIYCSRVDREPMNQCCCCCCYFRFSIIHGDRWTRYSALHVMAMMRMWGSLTDLLAVCSQCWQCSEKLLQNSTNLVYSTHVAQVCIVTIVSLGLVARTSLWIATQLSTLIFN